MTHKTAALYEQVLIRLHEVVSTVAPGNGFEVEVVISDFEAATQTTMERAFPGSRALGCWFHFGQVCPCF